MDNQGSTSSSGKAQSFVQKNRNPLIIAAIVIILLVIYFATRGSTETGQGGTNTNQTNTQQNSNSNTNSGNTNSQGNQGNSQTSGQNSSSPTPATEKPTSGNLAISGKLQKSEDPAKGNYVVEGSQGKIYIQTQRDYTSLVDKDVTLAAEGTLTDFTLVNITAAGEMDHDSMGGNTETPAPTPAVQGDATGGVTFSGKLTKSDNAEKGNYVITSGTTKVYLQSVRDYNAWLASDVTLTAEGSLGSFTAAKLMKK